MKIKLRESEIENYFKEVLSEDKLLSESITPTDKSDIKVLVKNEIKDFLNINRSSDFEKKIADIIKNKFKNDKEFEKYIVDVTKNVLVQLYKTMWTRKNFWTAELKNSPN